MRDACSVYEQSGFEQLDSENDPFQETSQKRDAILLGQSVIFLEGLALMLSCLDDERPFLPIVSASTSEICGKIYMNITPCLEDGEEDLGDDPLEDDDPNNLEGKELHFKVKIDKLTDLPENFCSNTYCEYQFSHLLDKKTYKTELAQGKNRNPELGYNCQHTVVCVTKNLLKYLLEDKLTIKIYGN
jgi:hypothetical protein